METKIRKKFDWALTAALVLPLALVGLFEALKGDQTLMNGWVFGVMAPTERFLGRLWSMVPFSMMEVFIALVLAVSVLWVLRAAVMVVRERDWRKLLKRLLALTALWLWLWAGLCWLWNAAYYTSPFTLRSDLKTTPYSVEKLAEVTDYFARHAAELSDRVRRDGEGHFDEFLDDCFDRGIPVYKNLTRDFPCLSMESIRAKPIVCSRLQSMMGFTGMYFPFTGEANVNVDAPACLVPATIGHEMAHQRMVASELEANFVGIAACVTSDDVVFQYSGYLMGLIELCNALYPVAPNVWYDIAQRNFTPELSCDWRDNNAYWASLNSPVEDAATEVYDTYLKRNDQELGMRSYGACVDLLVSYFGAAK